jgi:hypothetical protein
MVSRNITLSLPDAVAQEAEQKGLLAPEAIGQLICEELRRARADSFFAAADRISSVPHRITEAEIEAEIKAVRRLRA